MPDTITVTVTETNATIDVSPVDIAVYVSGSQGAFTPLNPNPAGSFVAASLTVDAYGRVTTASNTPDIASEATQQQILQQVNDLVADFVDIGIIGGLTWG